MNGPPLIYRLKSSIILTPPNLGSICSPLLCRWRPCYTRYKVLGLLEPLRVFTTISWTTDFKTCLSTTRVLQYPYKPVRKLKNYSTLAILIVRSVPPSASYPMPDASGASNARPHRRKQSTHHIPRAPNAFIVFRSHFYSNILGTQTGGDQRNVSRVAGAAWQGLTLEEKRAWHARAVEARQAHAVRYPEYRFTPSPRELEMTGRQRRRPGPVPPGEVEKERIKQKCARVAGLYLEDKEKNKEKMLQEMRSVDEMVNPHRTWKGFEDEASSRMEVS